MNEIEGLFSFAKKLVSKVTPLAKQLNSLGILPPGTSIGMSALNKLVASGKKVNFNPEQTQNIYQIAFTRGYQKAMNDIQEAMRKLKQ